LGRLFIVELHEKPTINFLIDRGIYILAPEVLGSIPTKGEFPITSLFEGLLADKKPISVYYSDDQWLDVGRPADWRQANSLT
jgi:NDP-sugar pyrophosphorylase family protein